MQTIYNGIVKCANMFNVLAEKIKIKTSNIINIIYTYTRCFIYLSQHLTPFLSDAPCVLLRFDLTLYSMGI